MTEAHSDKPSAAHSDKSTPFVPTPPKPKIDRDNDRRRAPELLATEALVKTKGPINTGQADPKSTRLGSPANSWCPVNPKPHHRRGRELTECQEGGRGRSARPFGEVKQRVNHQKFCEENTVSVQRSRSAVVDVARYLSGTKERTQSARDCRLDGAGPEATHQAQYRDENRAARRTAWCCRDMTCRATGKGRARIY